METATQASMRVNLRQRRAEVLAHEILRIASRYMDHDGERDFFYSLRQLFEEKGVDIITDYDREEAGLPPRGPDGWTIEELVAMEKRRLEAMTAPMVYTIPKVIRIDD